MSRLVYFGSPELAVPPLNTLLDAGHEIALVVSKPDARRGRGGVTTPSPVKAAAQEAGIPTTEDPEDALHVGAEFGVVVAYGRLLSPRLVAGLPMVNLHFSLLPRWRGAAPVERAILEGDEETGVCLMAIEEGLDTGGVYRTSSLPIGQQTLEELQTALVELGCVQLREALTNGLASLGPAVPQVGEATYAKKIKPSEYELDLSRPAAELLRTIRLGRAWVLDGTKRLRILQATLKSGDLAPGEVQGITVGTGAQLLELGDVQPEGRGRMDAASWSRGRRSTLRLGAPFEQDSL